MGRESNLGVGREVSGEGERWVERDIGEGREVGGEGDM